MIPAAFHVRSFRFQWPADLLVSCAFEMETLILGWYVMVNTGSVLLLTAFATLQFVGTLAAPMFGVAGDRIGNRTMLCAMRTSFAVLAALLMVLALAGALTPVWVFVVAAVNGIARPNDLVMRNALIGETIPPEHLTGALALSRASTDSARVAGALTGAGLSAALGVGLAYVVVTIFYVACLLLTLGVARSRPVADPTAAPRRVATIGAASWRDLKEGLGHVLATPKVLALLWLAFVVNLTAYPVTQGLLPYVARRVFMVDATGLGWLAASFSLGALAGSITMVVRGGRRGAVRSLLVATALWYVLLLAFAWAPTMGWGLAALLIGGFFQSVTMIAMSATLLEASGARFRARVMGVRQLVVYGMTLGLLGSGAVIEHVGYRVTISTWCAVGLLCTFFIALRWRASVWAQPSALPAAPTGASPRVP